MKKPVRLSQILLGFLIALSLFFHFFNLKDSLQFQGDQGRDAIIVADIFRKKDPVFIGPVTSVGNMYLGPLYYYFMLPFLWLTYPSPMGPVYAVAALGVVTAYGVYRFGTSLVGKAAALWATFFFVFSAAIIMGSRFSWNPNPAPLVSLLMMYTTYLAWKRDPRYWIGVAACFSVLIQLHYLTLLSLPAAGIFWFLDLFRRWRTKEISKRWSHLRPLLISTALGLLVFIVSLTPLILFDVKHQGTNAKAFSSMFSSGENFQYQSGKFITKVVKPIKEMEGRSLHIMFEYMIGKNRVLNQFLLYSAFVGLLYLLRQPNKKRLIPGESENGIWVIVSFLAFGITGTALYEHTIYDHYIAYLFPATSLLYGYLIAHIRPKWVSWMLGSIFAAYFLLHNIPILPLRDTGWKLSDIQRTSEAILDKVQPGEKYNIVLLSESRDIHGQNYRYFLTTGHTRPAAAEEQGDIDTLFIINEEKKTDRVVDSPIYEIVVFPNKNPSEVFHIENGPEITVLRRTTQDSSKPIE